MNEGLKKYSDHNKLVKQFGGVDKYNTMKINQGYTKGTGNKLMNIAEGIMIGYLLKDVVKGFLHKIGDKIDEFISKKEEENINIDEAKKDDNTNGVDDDNS